MASTDGPAPQAQSIDAFLEGLPGQLAAFHAEQRQAGESGLCIVCKEPALPKCYSDAGRREFGISGTCEPCFDGMFADPDEDE